MAAVGPIASMVIGIMATMIGNGLVVNTVYGVQNLPGEQSLQILALAGPVATIFLWLGPVNILLAIFNMVPGFPLDGGRVLRALIWWATGDIKKATFYASGVGQLFAWTLIGTGILMIVGVQVPVFGTGFGPGLWLVLIGWFLYGAAHMGYQQLLIREALDNVPVQAVMRSRIQSVPPELSVDQLIGEYFMNYDQWGFPVVDDSGDFLGTVQLGLIRSLPREQWPHTSVRDVMIPTRDLQVLHPQDSAMDAFGQLGNEEDIDQIPVVEGLQLRGMVERKDIMKWLSLHALPPRHSITQ
jgi:CBS domain-containing protein